MELIRGKTFIKSYSQNPVENVPSYGGKVKTNADSERHLNECAIKKNETNTRGIFSANVERSTFHGKSITKSKTHDCVTREHKQQKDSLEIGKNILSSSISFPGIDHRKKNESNVTGSSAYQQHIIDYRNFVPQMPFVPSVAKSLPRKRISLKRSRRGLKDIFSLKKNKQQDVPLSENERLGSLSFELRKGQGGRKQHLQPTEETYPDELLTHELSDNEMLVDSGGSCHVLCEDVASLKSFDSFTGCGEIFADESTAYIDMDKSKDGPKVMFITKAYPQGSNFQGGVEQLASPAKSEKIDFSRLCGQGSSSERGLRPNSLFDAPLLPNSNNVISKESKTASRDQLSNSTCNDPLSSSENITDSGSPVSTSDEGYYDSFSPGSEDDKRYMETPRSIPRESYSGDALYELFCDSQDTKLSPGQDCVNSLSGHTDNPASVYSFFVGSEENTASQPDNDLFRDGIPQSSWKGKECFLKLCDTELSLTMGLVNWLKKTGKFSESPNTNLSPSCKHIEKQEEVDNKSVLMSRESIHEINEKQITAEWQTYKKGCPRNVCRATDSECPQKNIILAQQPGETSDRMLQYHLSSPVSGLLSKDIVSFLIKTLCNGGKYRMDVNNPYISRLTNIGSVHLLSSIDMLPSSFQQDSLHCLDLQYLRSCVSPLLLENDKNLINLMEQCATQVASMQINPMDKHMDQENNVHIESITQPHEMSYNVTRSMESHDCKSEQTSPHPMLAFTPDVGNIRLETDEAGDTNVPTNDLVNNNKESDSSEKCNKECIIEENARPLFTKKSRPQWFNSRTNFLPLFGSRCSSVMSRCPSTLYRVCNTGEAILFLNTSNKCKDTFCNIEGPTKECSNTFPGGSSGIKNDQI